MKPWLPRAGLAVSLVAGVLRPAHGQTFDVLHHFAGAVADGPAGPVVQGSDGNLYGTTNSGPGASENGTFFKREPGQAPVTLHDFVALDGISPQMIVEGEDGNFYGVAAFGGEFGLGTAFRVTPEGDLTVLHHFAGPPDGALPVALILGSDGDFYGVGSQGGLGEEPCDFTIDGCGTLFRMTPQGAVTNLHTFTYDDGLYPNGLVEATDGNFYGTTSNGGEDCECGTVFRLTPGGSFTKLHDFDAATGSVPLGILAQANDGKLYGTVIGGLLGGRGGVFRMTLAGDVSLVHSFDGDDASNPAAGVIQAVDGLLYGTTNLGGDSDSGTVYRVDPAGGNFQVVHTFDGTDGENPFVASLLRANDGDLYGVTLTGGDNDAGVLFRLHFAPPAPLFCPNSLVRRDQMAVFLLKMMNGPAFTPPACSGDFGDVACPSLFADWIEALADAGITAGCGGGNFCPLAAIRRDQMAVFLLKAAHGSAFTPPACSGDFPDVPCPSLFADWIEALADEGITAGCGGGLFCPAAAVTRAQMSVFLLKIEHGSGYAPPACEAVFADVACPSQFADWIEQLYAEGITAGCAGPN